jgi:hypothetical protein
VLAVTESPARLLSRAISAFDPDRIPARDQRLAKE